MPVVPTVKVVKEDSDRGYMIIAEEDFDPDEHTLYGDESLSEEEEEESEEGEVTYDLAPNGFWTIYSGGEEVEKGRGKDSLEEALPKYRGE